jgi:microcystin-dependent protein
MDWYLGQIGIFPYSFAPKGWAFCDGKLLPIAEYTALFSLIGITFGGDGITTFALPDYQGSAPSGSHYLIYIEGRVPQVETETTDA